MDLISQNGQDSIFRISTMLADLESESLQQVVMSVDADGSTHYIGHIPVDVYTKAELPPNSERLVIQS